MFSSQTIAASSQQGHNNRYEFVCASCRWVAGPWSECSASCGSGFRHRQLSCHQVKANGSVLALLPGACSHRDRPAGRKPCTGHSCPVGPRQAKAQVSYSVCLESPRVIKVGHCHRATGWMFVVLWLNIFPLTQGRSFVSVITFQTSQLEILFCKVFSFCAVWATFVCWRHDLKPEY